MINKGSIHSNLSNPHFLSYAVSKAAMRRLTSSIALEFGDKVQFVCIEPAAVLTAMLIEGFDGSQQRIKELSRFHPTKALGTIEEVSELVNLLITNPMPFLNGSVINMDGGIGGRLHDPS